MRSPARISVGWADRQPPMFLRRPQTNFSAHLPKPSLGTISARSNRRSFRTHRHLRGIRIVVPQTIEFCFVRRAISGHEAITQDERFAGSDFQITGLLRCETEKRFGRMNALRLGGVGVVGGGGGWGGCV